jgi:hypothetical protein
MHVFSHERHAANEPRVFQKLKLAADKNGVSLSEMVRQGVDIAFSGK